MNCVNFLPHAPHYVRLKSSSYHCEGVSEAKDITRTFEFVKEENPENVFEQIDPTKTTQCQNCGKFERPSIFKNMPYCSDNCRKALGLDAEGNRLANSLNPRPEMRTELEKKLLQIISALLNGGPGALKRVDGKVALVLEMDKLENTHPHYVEFHFDRNEIVITREDHRD